MSCTSCYNRSCPEPVAVTVNQTFLVLGNATGIVDTYRETITGTVLTLPYAPLAGYTMLVFVNGIEQKPTTHYAVGGTDNKVITFVNTLAADDVSVVYAHLVPAGEPT